MDKNKVNSFMDHLNLFFVGLVIGGIVGACFGVNATNGKNVKAEKK